jgi:hypothetical protein
VHLPKLAVSALAIALIVPAVARSDEDQAAGSRATAQRDDATPRLGGAIDVTAVSMVMVAFDTQGHAVLDLRPDEVQVLEDGMQTALLELSPSARTAQTSGSAAVPPQPGHEQSAGARPWRVVVYVSTELAGRFVLPELCRRTGAEAARLTDLGPVDVVLADPQPQLIAEAGFRPEDVRLALERVAEDASGVTTVERIRSDFAKEFKPGVGFDIKAQAEQDLPRSFAVRARIAANRERSVIQSDLDRMVAWIQSQSPTTRGLLVWMTGGFDINPADFYLPLMEQLDPTLANSLRSEYQSLSLDEEVARLVEVALSYGWTVVPINASQTSFVYGAEVEGTGKSQHHSGVGASTLSSQERDFSQVAPNFPLRLVAKGTGGEFVANERQLQRALDRAKAAYQLTYQVNRPADGRLHRVEVRCSRPEVRIRSRDYVASGSLRGVATTRGKLLLAGEVIQGALAVTADVRNISRAGRGHRLADLGVTADLAELRLVLSAVNLGRLRLTVVVEIDDASPFVHHQEMELDWDETGDTWEFVTGISFPKNAKRMAVVVEELVSATWGAATVDLK